MNGRFLGFARVQLLDDPDKSVIKIRLDEAINNHEKQGHHARHKTRIIHRNTQRAASHVMEASLDNDATRDEPEDFQQDTTNKRSNTNNAI